MTTLEKIQNFQEELKLEKSLSVIEKAFKDGEISEDLFMKSWGKAEAAKHNGQWKTINGAKVLIGSNGEVVMGAGGALSKDKKESSSFKNKSEIADKHKLEGGELNKLLQIASIYAGTSDSMRKDGVKIHSASSTEDSLVKKGFLVKTKDKHFTLTSKAKDAQADYEKFISSKNKLEQEKVDKQNSEDKKESKPKKKPIEISPKVKKADLIKELVEKGNFEGNERGESDFKNDTLPELKKKVKIYNANIANGGDGNYSSWNNKEAYEHIASINAQGTEYLKEKSGMTPEELRDFGWKNTEIKDKFNKIQADWEAYVEKEHGGFIGHEDVDTAMKVFKKNIDEGIEIINKYKEKQKKEAGVDYESKTFDELTKIKKEKYSNMDIESPMSADEKLLEQALNKKASEMNTKVHEQNKVFKEEAKKKIKSVGFDSSKNIQIHYSGKTINAENLSFKEASQRIRDNLKTGETGLVKDKDGKVYEISTANNSAKGFGQVEKPKKEENKIGEKDNSWVLNNKERNNLLEHLKNISETKVGGVKKQDLLDSINSMKNTFSWGKEKYKKVSDAINSIHKEIN